MVRRLEPEGSDIRTATGLNIYLVVYIYSKHTHFVQLKHSHIEEFYVFNLYRKHYLLKCSLHSCSLDPDEVQRASGLISTLIWILTHLACFFDFKEGTHHLHLMTFIFQHALQIHTIKMKLKKGTVHIWCAMMMNDVPFP